jgi:flagellar motor switch protein FliN/FliY
MANPNVLRPYCKSVLQVQVPVVVTLARKSMQLDQVLKMVPGMMIQFDKPFDAPMRLEVDDQPIAEGDVVKAGDKFAIRITQVASPSERFVNLTDAIQSK